MRTRRQQLGQHFLRDRRVAEAIVAALPGEPARVIEIGPGQGALTRPLLARFPRVRAVELDPELARALPGRLGHPPGLEVVGEDALRSNLDLLTADGPWQVAANLPYSVGTAILRRILARGELFASVVVMVQLEVAERVVASPGGRDRGLLTLEVEGLAKAELLFQVPARCFAPPPRVTSAVLRLRPRQVAERPARLEMALALAAAAFTLRRKKITNALASAAPPPALRVALAAAAVDPASRPEDLTLDQWLELAAVLGRGTSLQ